MTTISWFLVLKQDVFNLLSGKLNHPGPLPCAICARHCPVSTIPHQIPLNVSILRVKSYSMLPMIFPQVLEESLYELFPNHDSNMFIFFTEQYKFIEKNILYSGTIPYISPYNVIFIKMQCLGLETAQRETYLLYKHKNPCHANTRVQTLEPT